MRWKKVDYLGCFLEKKRFSGGNDMGYGKKLKEYFNKWGIKKAHLRRPAQQIQRVFYFFSNAE